MILSCSMMVLPVFRTYSHVRATNASRPRSKRVLPSAASRFSTTFCVAMPAWSVPGSHSAARPRIRSKRISTSWITLFSACPTCRTSVTLGGGMTMTYGSPSGRGWKTPASSQRL